MCTKTVLVFKKEFVDFMDFVVDDGLYFFRDKRGGCERKIILGYGSSLFGNRKHF